MRGLCVIVFVRERTDERTATLADVRAIQQAGEAQVRLFVPRFEHRFDALQVLKARRQAVPNDKGPATREIRTDCLDHCIDVHTCSQCGCPRGGGASPWNVARSER